MNTYFDTTLPHNNKRYYGVILANGNFPIFRKTLNIEITKQLRFSDFINF